MVPENVIQAETDTSIEDLGDARAASDDECLQNVVRLGMQVARFEMVARTSASDRRHKRTGSRAQAARR